MPRLSAMHLPFDIYILISKIRWNTSTTSNRTTVQKDDLRPTEDIYRPRESQYPGTSRNTIRFTSCTRREQIAGIYLPPGTGARIREFLSLRYRAGHVREGHRRTFRFHRKPREEMYTRGRQGHFPSIARGISRQYSPWIRDAEKQYRCKLRNIKLPRSIRIASKYSFFNPLKRTFFLLTFFCEI